MSVSNRSTSAVGGGEKLDFKRVAPVFVVVLVDLLGLTIIIPLMPLYAASFGANAFLIGVLGAAYPVMQVVGAPILGRLSDRYGRKPVLLVSQVGTFIGFVLLGSADTLWLLFLARIIDGLSGGNISTAQAVISDITTEETRTQGLGLIGAAFGIGFIIGPVIAFVSLALSGNNYHVPAFVAAGFSLISILLTWFLLEETLERSPDSAQSTAAGFSISRLLSVLGLPQVGLLLGLMFLQQIAFGGFEQLLALFTLNRLGLNASGNAAIFVYVGVIVVFVQVYFIGRWSRRWGDRNLVYLGLAALALGLTLMALTPSEPAPWYRPELLREELFESGDVRAHETPVTKSLAVEIPEKAGDSWLGVGWILAALLPTSIGGGILRPGINSLLTKRVVAGDVGGVLGLSSAFNSAANAIAPVLGGALFQILGSTAPFLTFGLIMLGLFLLALRRLQPAEGIERVTLQDPVPPDR
ncbi:MAG: MFS transporter [Anaerolineales bacterium]|nr:MFS transporter [Anaerolineales bacterium]